MVISDDNIEIKYEGSSGVSDKVYSGARVFITEGPLMMGTDAVVVEGSEEQYSDLVLEMRFSVAPGA